MRLGSTQLSDHLYTQKSHQNPWNSAYPLSSYCWVEGGNGQPRWDDESPAKTLSCAIQGHFLNMLNLKITTNGESHPEPYHIGDSNWWSPVLPTEIARAACKMKTLGKVGKWLALTLTSMGSFGSALHTALPLIPADLGLHTGTNWYSVLNVALPYNGETPVLTQCLCGVMLTFVWCCY